LSSSGQNTTTNLASDSNNNVTTQPIPNPMADLLGLFGPATQQDGGELSTYVNQPLQSDVLSGFINVASSNFMAMIPNMFNAVFSGALIQFQNRIPRVLLIKCA